MIDRNGTLDQIVFLTVTLRVPVHLVDSGHLVFEDLRILAKFDDQRRLSIRIGDVDNFEHAAKTALTNLVGDDVAILEDDPVGPLELGHVLLIPGKNAIQHFITGLKITIYS